MRGMRNPFRLQVAENIETDIDFLKLIDPTVLELLPDESFHGKILFIRSAPGGGKTSLLRLFSPSLLKTLLSLKDTDPYKEVFERLNKINVVNKTDILVCSIMISASRTFPSLNDLGLSEVRAKRLLLALFDARIIMSALRSLLISENYQFPDGLSEIRILPLPDTLSIPGLNIPCTGLDAYIWAEELERAVCDSIDDIVPNDEKQISGHDFLYSLRILDNNILRLGQKNLQRRWLLLLDDVHKLTSNQRQHLTETLLEQRSNTSTWIAERLEALSKDELLASGALEKRDYHKIINLEDSWRKHRFDTVATSISEKRVQMAANELSSKIIGSFTASVNTEVDYSRCDINLEKATTIIRNRVYTLTQNIRKYDDWIRNAESNLEISKDNLLTWRIIEILIERDRRKPQFSFDFDLPADELEERKGASLKTSADLFLTLEFDWPYYYGTQCIANLGFCNIEQYLRIAGDLFEETLGSAIIGKNQTIPPDRQQKILRKASDLRISELPRRASNGRDVLRFIDAVGAFCNQETYRPSAPYAPGVTGIALLMSDRDKLLDNTFLEKRPSLKKLSEILQTALSNNLFHAILDHKAKGNQYMVLYLNRLLCLKYSLPLQFGGFRERPIDTYAKWIENGYTLSKSEELF